jgi:hypothetical protein
MKLPHVDDATTELIDETLRATKHGQDLTGDLLAFSRRRQLNPQPVAINALVENIVRLLTRTLGASVKITTAASRDASGSPTTEGCTNRLARRRERASLSGPPAVDSAISRRCGSTAATE